jgi:hypothetical protein
MKESHSLHLETQTAGGSRTPSPGNTPGEDGSKYSDDLFEAFSSVTLQYDGEM